MPTTACAQRALCKQTAWRPRPPAADSVVLKSPKRQGARAGGVPPARPQLRKSSSAAPRQAPGTRSASMRLVEGGQHQQTLGRQKTSAPPLWQQRTSAGTPACPSYSTYGRPCVTDGRRRAHRPAQSPRRQPDEAICAQVETTLE